MVFLREGFSLIISDPRDTTLHRFPSTQHVHLKSIINTQKFSSVMESRCLVSLHSKLIFAHPQGYHRKPKYMVFSGKLQHHDTNYYV